MSSAKRIREIREEQQCSLQQAEEVVETEYWVNEINKTSNLRELKEVIVKILERKF